MKPYPIRLLDSCFRADDEKIRTDKNNVITFCITQRSCMKLCAYFVSQNFTSIRGAKIKKACVIVPVAPDKLLKKLDINCSAANWYIMSWIIADKKCPYFVNNNICTTHPHGNSKESLRINRMV